ncbi:MAG: Si-specific NAD(P)(+) transhydrogenase [Simkaniaceae bacterium]|nr:Si-specific NAD(P)(+) transhydrogenase [Simkaniaceae bacterium]
MLEEYYADLVVIGSGPSGQKAAIQSAKLGKKVVMIEKDQYPGGACLNSGTIPSKSLREAIIDLTNFYRRSFYAKEKTRDKEISIKDLNYRLNCVLDQQREMFLKQFERNKIRLLSGSASFENMQQVNVTNAEGAITHKVTGEFFIIATGSKPRNPNNVPFDDKRVLDSTRLLSIEKLPKSMLVLGGGIIGSEYASFFAALGTKVTIIDKKEQMLPLLDKEIGLHLQNSLTDIGLEFLGKKEVKEIVQKNDQVVVKFKEGDTIEAETLLYALGRIANVDHLHIDRAGITVDEKGYIPVNALFQTCVPSIYAIGDVIGGPALASTSMEQGRLAARHAFGKKTHHFPSFYPIGIYTIPEISSCGYTEEALKELGFQYEVGRCYYYEIARNQITGNDPGMFKILFHRDTLEILGIHIIGRAATEVIHIGQVAMTFNAKVDYFIDQVFNYPTYAEGYRIAALNGYNKLVRN